MLTVVDILLLLFISFLFIFLFYFYSFLFFFWLFITCYAPQCYYTWVHWKSCQCHSRMFSFFSFLFFSFSFLLSLYISLFIINNSKLQKKMLQSNQHNGFPVVTKTRDGRKVFEGIILRSQLIVILNQKAFFQRVSRDFYFQNGGSFSLPVLSDNNPLSPTNAGQSLRRIIIIN